MPEASPKDVIRQYESILIVNPDCSEDDQKKLLKKNHEIIEKFSGSVNHVDSWGKRYLSNPVKKFKKALFFHSTFEAYPSGIAELERTMLINDVVLRFCHTRLKEGTSLAKHLDEYRETIKQSAQREKEKEVRFKARRQSS